VGWAIAFWATPTMTVAHLLFAGLMTGYMLLAVVFEERDLVRYHGAAYREYRRRVPMFVPRPGMSVQSETELLSPTPTESVSS
jgi:protein-S-isoprenylcysteine O-methyltransferase Ste14